MGTGRKLCYEGRRPHATPVNENYVKPETPVVMYERPSRHEPAVVVYVCLIIHQLATAVVLYDSPTRHQPVVMVV